MTSEPTAAASDLRLDLREPVAGVDDLTAISLRYPTAREILAHGYPYSYQATAADDVVAVEHHDAIAFYAEACIVSERRQEILDGLSMIDAMELRERVMGFFLSAQKKRRSSGAS